MVKMPSNLDGEILLASLGETREVNGPSFAGYSAHGRQDFCEIYTSLPGYAIYETSYHEHAGHGDFRFGLSTLAEGSSLVNLEEIEHTYSSMINYCGTMSSNSYALKLDQELKQLDRVYRKLESTHNVVKLSGQIAPTYDFLGFRTARGHLRITTKVTLLRLITKQELEKIVREHKLALGLVID